MTPTIRCNGHDRMKDFATVWDADRAGVLGYQRVGGDADDWESTISDKETDSERLDAVTSPRRALGGVPPVQATD